MKSAFNCFLEHIGNSIRKSIAVTSKAQYFDSYITYSLCISLQRQSAFLKISYAEWKRVLLWNKVTWGDSANLSGIFSFSFCKCVVKNILKYTKYTIKKKIGNASNMILDL